MSELTPISILYAWFLQNVPTFKKSKAETEFRDSGTGTARVRVDTNKFMTEITVKNKGLNLDIEVINLENDVSEFPHIGECKSMTDFERQLEGFMIGFIEANPEEVIDYGTPE